MAAKRVVLRRAKGNRPNMHSLVNRARFVNGFWDAVRQGRRGGKPRHASAGTPQNHTSVSVAKLAYAVGYGAGRVAVEQEAGDHVPVSAESAYQYVAVADPSLAE